VHFAFVHFAFVHFAFVHFAFVHFHIFAFVHSQRKVPPMRESVIVSAVRTPTGKFLGALKDFTAPQLGALVVAEAVRRAGIDPAIVDECIMGNVVAAGNGQNPARQAALNGGLPDRVAALTINKVCGSGLKAVMLADQGIRVGDIDVAVAGGMESMSSCPYLLPRVREGLRMGDGQLVDAMIHDGLWCAFEQWHMGNAGEVVAEQYRVGREAQDDYAARSHQKAAHATDSGWFRDEILPISIPQKKGAPAIMDRDEGIRADTTAGTLAALKPAFKKDGSVTAGNAPGVNDGASALVVMAADRAKTLGLTPLARIVGQATSGLAPKLVLMTPVEAVLRVAQKTGWDLKDVDLFELNEAFAVQAVAVLHELGLDPGKVNVNGGAVALGHAIGSSGGRVLTTLLYALKRRNLKRGIATLCLGGGNGVALAVERP
jgi:acetyl-CoA C-acetyltransferase